MARARSVNEMMAMKHRTIPFSKPWADAFGAPGWTGMWFVWGKSGSGKTSFMLQLCKELCRHFKGVYNSLEEGASVTIQNAIKQHDMMSVNSRLSFLDAEPMDELSARMDKRMSPHFYIIDSIQYTGFNINTLHDFVAAHKNKLIIFVSQTRGEQPAGRTAEKAKFDAALKIWVEGFRAKSHGRTFGSVGYYDVWPERAREYWGSKKRKITPTNEIL